MFTFEPLLLVVEGSIVLSNHAREARFVVRELYLLSKDWIVCIAL